ncbi:MAG: YdbH domain-containing protein [Erythrobacter sp.]
MAQAKPPSLDTQDLASQERLDALASVRENKRGVWPQKWRWRISLILFVILSIITAIVWFNREEIAGSLIDDVIADAGVEVSYDITAIGPQQQILSNVIVGDPESPDLTAETIIVDIGYSLRVPEITRIEVVNPRLYGSYREGVFSLGSLDSVLFAPSDEPPALPALDVAIVDGRASFISDFGTVGVKMDGAGRIDDGFVGTIAATAPGLGIDDCRAQTVTIYGELTTSNGRPRFDGPIRLGEGVCAGTSLKAANIAAKIELAPDLASMDGGFDFEADSLAYSHASLESLAGNAELTWSFDARESGQTDGSLVVRHELTGSQLAIPELQIDTVNLDGTMRASSGMDRADWDGSFRGDGARVALGDEGVLADARDVSDGTLLAPLLAKFERGLSRSVRNGNLAGDVTVRANENGLAVIIPEARLRSVSGETVLAVSRISYSDGGELGAGSRLTGNILTGGVDLPRINGRMEQIDGGELALRLTMAEYSAGPNAIAIPRLLVRQDRSGRVRFDGIFRADGAIPGGSVQGLALPLEGAWSSASGLEIGNECTSVRFDALAYAALALQQQAISLCPTDGAAMVRYGDGLNIAMETRDLDLAGSLSDTPTTITAQRALVQYPGPFVLEGVGATIGPDDSAIRLSVANLEGSIGAPDDVQVGGEGATTDDAIGGVFAGATAAMDVVPLDISGLGGTWDYTDGILSLNQGAFILTERTGPGLAERERFEPLIAQGANLTLADNRIRANADLRHPLSGALVAALDISHDLNDSTGRADLNVLGIRFGDGLQPADLSYLARGVIALARGDVSGEGVIEWTADDIESSGVFRTDSFDFAAAFGPVSDVSGEIVFTDLINLTTAPSQVINIGSVNPGVEALGGRVVYSLTNGQIVTLEDGRWPFMGGELILRPATLIYGGKGGQRYVFELVGLDAAVFVAQMELTNLGATGVFDGTIPIYFDALGNGSIEGGLLISRQPGGNIAYVGELTYEDMGAVANYAFQTLRSLDYRQMSIELNGSLAGEILTNFNIDGIQQGDGASRNFITREIAKLPIRFKINVRSDNFYLLATIVRGLFDPTAFGDPIDQGLLNFEGGQIVTRQSSPQPIPPDPPPENSPQTDNVQRRDEPAVQPPESDDLS